MFPLSQVFRKSGSNIHNFLPRLSIAKVRHGLNVIDNITFLFQCKYRCPSSGNTVNRNNIFQPCLLVFVVEHQIYGSPFVLAYPFPLLQYMHFVKIVDCSFSFLLCEFFLQLAEIQLKNCFKE